MGKRVPRCWGGPGGWPSHPTVQSALQVALEHSCVVDVHPPSGSQPDLLICPTFFLPTSLVEIYMRLWLCDLHQRSCHPPGSTHWVLEGVLGGEPNATSQANCVANAIARLVTAGCPVAASRFLADNRPSWSASPSEKRPWDGDICMVHVCSAATGVASLLALSDGAMHFISRLRSRSSSAGIRHVALVVSKFVLHSVVLEYGLRRLPSPGRPRAPATGSMARPLLGLGVDIHQRVRSPAVGDGVRRGGRKSACCVYRADAVVLNADFAQAGDLPVFDTVAARLICARLPGTLVVFDFMLYLGAGVT